jgi:Kef-type K+ transport system membrane component KefB
MPVIERRSAWAGLAYGAMILGAVLLFLLIRHYGKELAAPASSEPVVIGPTSRSAPDLVAHLLLALAAVIVAGRLVGRLFRWLGQPPVIGEVIGGILLGPSCLGWILPETYAFVLPPSIAPILGSIAQLGVILYMFLVGLHLNADLLRGRVHAIVGTSHASIVLPFVLGAALALFLYPSYSRADVPFTSFALFVGVAMSITAFPVLARILSDLAMTHSDLGAIALTCAAIDDVTAWCLLAFVVGIVQSNAESALPVAVLTLGFIAVMFGLVRPAAARLVERAEGRHATDSAVALVLLGVLLAALTTELIGVHAIFGAFLFGAVMPHDSQLARTFRGSFEHVVTILLLPAFFAFTGMRTEIGLVSGWADWGVCALIITVASAGKFGGTLIAGRVTGLSWRYASALGVLMNTRGLMELIVLNVGLELGVISPRLFTMFVLMALVTTIATTPILRRLVPDAGGALRTVPRASASL